MPNTSRISDIGVGVCYRHHSPKPAVGFILTGCITKQVEFMREATLLSILITECNHVGIMITGAPSAFTENLNTSRIMDCFAGDFVGCLVTGALTHFTGNG